LPRFVKRPLKKIAIFFQPGNGGFQGLCCRNAPSGAKSNRLLAAFSKKLFAGFCRQSGTREPLSAVWLLKARLGFKISLLLS